MRFRCDADEVAAKSANVRTCLPARIYYAALRQVKRSPRVALSSVARLRAEGIPVQTGRFRATMQVALVNDGPVTLWIDTAEGMRT